MTISDKNLEFIKKETENDESFKYIMSDCLNSSSTTEDVLLNIDLKDQIAIITGANSGIGAETAKALATKGCQVILACRSEVKSNKFIQEIHKYNKEANIIFMHCDLASFKSVKKFAQNFISMNLSLNYLILNAAVNGLSQEFTEDGFERTFQINYLSNFYLVRLLEPSLKSSRVVIVSSESHRQSLLSQSNLDRPFSRLNFLSFFSYNDSKLMGILFASELNRRWKETGIRAVSCHPGNLVFTNIQRNSWILKSIYYLAYFFTKTPNQAAATVIYSAIVPQNDNDQLLKYYNNCQECSPSSSAANINLAKDLWNYSENLLTEHLNI